MEAASEAKIKLDKKNRQLLIYLTFIKEVEEYEPEGFLPVDINEDNATILVDGEAYLFETSQKKLVLSYYYRKKRIQEKYDKIYGTKSRIKRKAMRKLKEKKKKNDVKWKIANIIVKTAYERKYAIVLEKLGKKAANNMIKRIRDKQLRHRIFQASFRGIQRAIEEKARENGVPVVYIDPKNTSKLCPIHGALIKYNSSRVGKCSIGGEKWHRDIVAVWNLLFRVWGDGSHAPSPTKQNVDGRSFPFSATTTHDPTRIPISVWARQKSLPQIQKATILNKMKW